MEAGKEFLTASEVSELLGLQVDTFRDLVAKSWFPQAHPVSTRIRVWSREDVQDMVYTLKNMIRFKVMTPDEAAKEELLDK